MFRFRLLNGRKNNQISVLTLRFFDSPVAHKGNRTTVDSHTSVTRCLGADCFRDHTRELQNNRARTTVVARARKIM